jgi:flagellar biosynthesis anti-sigma factor FlgM
MQPLSSIPSHSVPSSPVKETLHTPATVKNTVDHSPPPQQVESISISQTQQEIKHYTEAMADLPDIRKERIIQIQLALENDTYSVSSTDLADKIIQELSNKPSDP